MNPTTVHFRLFRESRPVFDSAIGYSRSRGNGLIQFFPTEMLGCEYQVKLHGRHREKSINAIETSVIWLTSGKGQEDIGVHFFERRENKMVSADVLRQTYKLSTVLPKSPLSYDGEIVKISWCVRVRMFFADGLQITEDCAFRLGNAMLAKSNEDLAESEDTSSDAA